MRLSRGCVVPADRGDVDALDDGLPGVVRDDRVRQLRGDGPGLRRDPADVLAGRPRSAATRCRRSPSCTGRPAPPSGSPTCCSARWTGSGGGCATARSTRCWCGRRRCSPRWRRTGSRCAGWAVSLQGAAGPGLALARLDIDWTPLKLLLVPVMLLSGGGDLRRRCSWRGRPSSSGRRTPPRCRTPSPTAAARCSSTRRRSSPRTWCAG